MHQYRITKYDPKYRDAQGRYKRSDWDASGEVHTAEFIPVENRYVQAIEELYRKVGAPPLVATGVEWQALQGSSPIADGQVVAKDKLATVIRMCLREQMWCRMEAQDRSFMIHFGEDRAVYVLGTHPALAMLPQAIGDLFLEPHASPYL